MQFHLERDEDESGVSGTGRVAEGVEFPDGQCVLWWKGGLRSVGLYHSLKDLEAIHGRHGLTRIVAD